MQQWQRPAAKGVNMALTVHLSVCLSICHSRALRQNRCTERDATYVLQSNVVLDRGRQTPTLTKKQPCWKNSSQIRRLQRSLIFHGRHGLHMSAHLSAICNSIAISRLFMHGHAGSNRAYMTRDENVKNMK